MRSAFRCDSGFLRPLVGRRLDEKSVKSFLGPTLGLSPADDEDKTAIGGWLVCGHEVQLSLHKETIEDAIFIPSHSRRYPQSAGDCTIENLKIPELVYAILDNPDLGPVDSTRYAVEDTVQLRPLVAWKVDAKTGKFISLPTEHLKCARADIFTVDGGR